MAGTKNKQNPHTLPPLWAEHQNRLDLWREWELIQGQDLETLIQRWDAAAGFLWQEEQTGYNNTPLHEDRVQVYIWIGERRGQLEDEMANTQEAAA